MTHPTREQPATLSKRLKSRVMMPARITSGMTSAVQESSLASSKTNVLRIASVSYLNATPLIYGLDADPNRKLLLEVPAKLIDLLREDRADVALLPVIDYQRIENLCVVPVGG